ncbi:hypothetical protein J3D48_005426 [Pseudomonas fluorescens]|nr:hypothetical protein [Pseudomonas fluorescens]
MGDLSKIAHFFRLQKDRSLRQLLQDRVFTRSM